MVAIDSHVAVPSRRMVVVTAMIRTAPVIIARRADLYADASRARVNIHLRERRHRCRGNERARGNGSKCELFHGTSFLSRFATYENASARRAVPICLLVCARKRDGTSRRPCGGDFHIILAVVRPQRIERR